MIYETGPYVELLRRLAPFAKRIVSDTRDVRDGDAFIALAGRKFDAKAAACAMADRLSAIVYEDDGTVLEAPVATIAVPHLRENLGAFANGFYRDPGRRMHVVAVTGTNGKTTTSHWLAQLLSALDCKAGAVGTVGSFLDGKPFGTTRLTTPDAVSLATLVASMRQAGAKAVTLEASSIGIEEGRIDGLAIQTAIFTNLTRDHLDYHGDMAAYERAKTRLFSREGLENAVVNIDDEAGRRIAEVCMRRRLNLIVTTSREAIPPLGAKCLAARKVRATANGMAFELAFSGRTAQARMNILGQFNLDNLLGVAGAALALGFDLEAIARALPVLAAPKGRMQQVTEDASPLAIIDYSHTPDAVRKALEALRGVCRVRKGRLVAVLGAGGDRDKGKRPEMARIAEELADEVILTSDNPRSEDPQAILEDMLAGVKGRTVRTIADRREAIAAAVAEAAPEDVILIAGKGHEDYQEIEGVKHPFSDEVEARCAMLARHPGPEVKTDLAELVANLAGARLVGANVPFTHVQTDSRRIGKGGLFFAIRGEKFDGHDFLEAVREAGAVAVVVDRQSYFPLPQVVVPDTRKALLESAAFWRKKCGTRVIAVAGSNGKTTTTQMIASILDQAFGVRAVATAGNFNNDIGVPLTLWRLAPDTELAVVEAGMNHPGEMAPLAEAIAPDVAVVTNAQREHLAYIASIETSARENGEIVRALSETGTAVIPSDEEGTAIWREMAQGRSVRTFSFMGQSDVAGFLREPGSALLRTPGGQIAVKLSIAGRHNVRNAAAAACAALACGIGLETVKKGLEAFRPVRRRGERHEGPRATVIDDSYNANVDSICADIDLLKDEKAPALLVLGDMAETGEALADVHGQVGAYAAKNAVAGLIALGPGMTIAFRTYKEMFPEGRGAAFEDRDAFLECLKEGVGGYRTVLVKASNSMGFDEVVRHVLDALGMH